MGRLLQLLLRAVAACAVMLALGDAAYGHAVVLETAPADGAVLPHAPDHVTIVFNEPVAPVAAQVLDPAGQNVSGAVHAQDRELHIMLAPASAEGSYVASFRVVSADSHPVSGSIVFSVGKASARTAGESPHDIGWRLAMIAVQVAIYAGIFGGTGGLLFVMAVRPPVGVARSAATLAASMAAGGVVAALFAIGVQGGLIMAEPAGGLASAAVWRAGIESVFGRTAVTAFVGLALLVAGLGLNMRAVGCVGAVAALASFALSGHFVTAVPLWITVPTLVLHAAAVVFWVGALVPLHRAVGALGAGAAPLVRQVSRLARWAVPVLIASGLVIAVVQVGSLPALVTTTYGWVLLAKVVGVASAMALASLHRARLARLLSGGGSRAARMLRRAIAAELAIVVAVLAATAALGTTSPPRAFDPRAGRDGHDHHAIARSATAVDGGRRAEFAVTSIGRGLVSVRIALSDRNAAPLRAAEAVLTAASPAAGVEPIRRQAMPAGPGVWRVDGLVLSPRGTWTLGVEALVSDFEKVTLEAEIDLR